jgi:Tol biopolymer transport system component
MAPVLVAAASLMLAGGATSGPAGCCREPPVFDYGPQWSPDGSRIAFARYTRWDSRRRLFSVLASGGDERQLADLAYSPFAFRLSPDWTKVAFYDSGSLGVMNIDGSERHRIASWLWSFDWSPDGARLVFTAGETARDLFTVNADGTALRSLGTGFDADWSPVGDRLAFVDVDGLYISKIDGTDRRRIFSARVSAPSWSRDGRRLAFVNDGVFHVVTPDGDPLVAVDGRFPPSKTDWSRDGALVALRNDAGTSVIDLAQLAVRAVRGTEAVWSPTDDRLALVATEPCSPSGIHVTTLEPRTTRRLTLRCQFVGTRRNDMLVGQDQKDLLYGLGGSDRMYGEGFEDQLFGGRGADRLDGGSFGDVLQGGPGNDRLFGGNYDQDDYSFWDDFLYGGPGADDLRGGPGRDKLMGDAGNDVLHGDVDADVFFGGPGNDRIFAEADPERGFGNRRRDKITCGRGRDVVHADKVDLVGGDCEVVRKE